MRITLTFMLCVAVTTVLGCGGGDAGKGPGTGGTSSSSSSSSDRDGSSSTASDNAPAPANPHATTTPGGWGSIKGRFVYVGTPPTRPEVTITKDKQCCTVKLKSEELIVADDGGIANIVIFVRTKDVPIHEDYQAQASESFEYDNLDCRFEPHVLPIWTKQKLIIHNSDTCAHNTNMAPAGDQGINPLIPPKEQVEHQFGRQQVKPVKVNCNIHPWMNGYVLPRDNPYFAVTKEDGTFEIANLPSQEIEFQVWHEKKGYLELEGWDKGRFEQAIPAGELDLGEIKVSPSVIE
jgi:hypothetical protein